MTDRHDGIGRGSVHWYVLASSIRGGESRRSSTDVSFGQQWVTPTMTLETIVIIVIIILIVLFVLGYFGRGRFRR